MRLTSGIQYVPIVVAAFITVVPIAYLLFGSVWSSNPGLPGSLTFQNYVSILGDSSTPSILFNSLAFALGSAIFSTLLALLLSFIIERTDAPFRRIAGYSLLVVLALPWMVEDMSWTYLMSPRTGLYNVWISSLTGYQRPLLNIYSIWGMIWAMGLSLTPLAYLIISRSLKQVDPSLEEVSRINGASLRTTLLKIDVPLILPSAISATLLGFVISLEAFDISAIIGVPGNVRTFTNSIYRAIVGEVPPNYGLASGYAVFLVAITTIAILLYARATRIGQKYATVSGRTGRPRVFSLGRWRPVGGVVLLGYIFLYPVPVIGTLLFASLHSFWNPSQLPPLTFQNYIDLLDFPELRSGIPNSFIVSGTSAVATLSFAFFVAYLSVTKRGKVGTIAEIVTSLPLAFPTIVLGVGLLWAFIYAPIAIYGTVWALTLAYTIRYIPLVTRFLNGPILQLHRELEEVSRVSGASFAQTIRRITLPILRPSLVAAGLYVFIVSIKDLGAAILLVTQNSNVLSASIFNIWYKGDTLIAAAGGIFFVVIISAVLIVARLAFNVDPLMLIEPESRRS